MMKSKKKTVKEISKNRLILLLVGFSLLVIPLLLFSYGFDKYCSLTKDKTNETIRQLIFQQTKRIKNNIDPINYLKNEFSKINSDLIPDFPDEFTNGYADKDYISNIYNKNLFDRILLIIKDRFDPILVTLGTNNMEKVYAYFSPEFLAQLKGNERLLLDAKNYKDFLFILEEYKSYFENFDKIPTSKYFKYLAQIRENNSKDYFDEICYKYLSRYHSYISNYIPIYSDYFDKQLIYPITHYTLSINGIHGYYSTIIKQSNIDPYNIIKSVITDKDPIHIELVDDKLPSIINEKETGLEYRINYTTVFLTQINAFKRLRGLDRSDLLNKQLKISINYPKELLTLEKANKLIKLLPFIIFPIIVILYFIIISCKLIHLSLTRKVIFILFTIIFLPIIGTFIFIKTSAHNIEIYITQNISKALHNHLESYVFRDKENNLNFINVILELKKKLAKVKLHKNIPFIYNDLLTQNETFSYYYKWTNGLKVLSSDNNFYTFDDEGKNYETGKNNNKREEHKKTEDKYYKFLLEKYMKNLGLSNNLNKTQSDDIKSTFSLGIIEDYFSSEIEEEHIPLESIPHRDFITGTKSNDLCLLSYAQDKEKKDYILYTKKTDNNTSPYIYINAYHSIVNPFCFSPNNKFANIDIAFIFNDSLNKKRLIWPSISNLKPNMMDLVNDSLVNKDSINEITELNNENIIKERIITDNNPLMVVGIATSNNKKLIDSYINLCFLVIIIYSFILLIFLTDFLSIFIKKPITIYQTAIKHLQNYHYGTTINSFSKDEFNEITKAFNEMSVAIKQKEDLKRYVSELLVKTVEEKEIQNNEEGKIEQVTVLSSDIRNFTGISELYEPAEIVELLNSYFTKMQQAISSNGGIIDKYIGDAIQAVFYDENQVLSASLAALSMRKALKELNEERESKGLFTIENGIGIDTDNALIGTIGTKNGRKDFSVNGEVIVRAANLESKTKMTNTKILISKKSIEKIISKITYKNFDEDSIELVDVRK